MSRSDIWFGTGDDEMSVGFPVYFVVLNAKNWALRNCEFIYFIYLFTKIDHKQIGYIHKQMGYIHKQIGYIHLSTTAS